MDTLIEEEVAGQKKRKFIFTAIIIVAALILSVLLVRSFFKSSLKKSEITTAVVEKGRIENTINASGEVLPEFEEIITSPINASIKNVVMDAGSNINIGQSVLTLDKGSSETEYEKQKFQLESKRNSIHKLKLELDKSFFDMKSNDNIKELRINSLLADVENAKRLYKAGGGTREDIEKAELNLKVARLEKNQLENEIKNKQQTMQVEMRESEIAAAIQENELHELEKMYKADDLTEETEEIVLKRQRNSVEFAQFSLDNAKLDSEEMTKVRIPRMDIRMKEMLDRTALELNTLGDGESRQAYRAVLVKYLSGHKDRLSKESLERLERNPLRILDSKDEGDQAIVAGAPIYTDYLNAASREFFDAVRRDLDSVAIAYEINRRWTVNAAVQWLSAIQNSPLQPLINGLVPENTPKWLGNLSVTYRPPVVPGLTLTAGSSGVSKRPVNPQDQGYIPGYFLYTTSASYVTRIADHRASFLFSVDNVGNLRYWNSVQTGTYGTGMDRTFKFSTKIDF